MIKMHCDRCGEEIKGVSYYAININKKSHVFVDYPSAITSLTSSYSANSNANIPINAEKHYCEKCKNEIETFISNNPNTKV